MENTAAAADTTDSTSTAATEAPEPISMGVSAYDDSSTAANNTGDGKDDAAGTNQARVGYSNLAPAMAGIGLSELFAKPSTHEGAFLAEAMSMAQDVPVKEIKGIVPRTNVIVVGKSVHTFEDQSIPEPKTLALTTLTGVIDLVKTLGNQSGIILHVASPIAVQIIRPFVGPETQNLVYAQSTPLLPKQMFGQYMDSESFIIWLMSCFINSETRQDLQRLASSFKLGLLKEMEDDGVSTKITTSKGITGGINQTISNPYYLQAFRTFPEVEQPLTPYVFRMAQNEAGGKFTATAALFEADGGAWRPAAVLGIGDFLRNGLLDAKIEGVTVIA